MMLNATAKWTSVTVAAIVALSVAAQNAPPPAGAGTTGQPPAQAQQAPPPGPRPGGPGEAGGRQGRGDQRAPQRPAWEEFQLDPNKRIELRFRNANADLVFELFGRASGITILKDPNLRQTLTVTSPRAVTLREAFEILDVALSLRGFGLRKQGNMMIAGPRRQERNPFEGLSPDQIEAVQNAGRTETRVFPIRHANATQVERVVRDVFGAMTRNDMLPFMFGFEVAMPVVDGGSRRGGQRTQGDVRVSSDDFSNSVIVNAPRTLFPQIEQLINEIDKPSEAPMRAHVYRLEFAVATEVAPIVQNVLVSNAPRGRGGAGNQQVSPFARMGVAMRFGSADVAFGSVLADERSNSLVVTATEDNHRIIAQVITELDQEVEVVDTTFIVPLNNARADEMAQLLNSSFGGRVGGGGFGQFGARAGQGRQWQQQQQGRRGGQRGSAPRVGRSVEDSYQLSEQELHLMLADPSLDAGELMTVVSAQPFQFFGGGMQRRPGAQTGAPARGADGRLVNVRDLEGQVSIIADPNTNSLIIVTDPQNMELVRSLVEQLDRIPEQVMIETIIVEASLDADTKLGVEWTMAQDKLLGNPGVTGAGGTRFGLRNATPPLEGFHYSVTGGNIGGFLHMLQTDDRFHVLSTPRIFTSNNVEAEINISQRVPYVVSQREDAAGNITFNYAFEDVGIVLRVTPRITANGYVTLDVVQTANDLQGFTAFNAPIVNQRQAQTTVAVMDGETIILGGIIRTTVTSNVRKLPVLGDIPILGNLFRTTERNNQKTELLVFLTPRVVRNPDDARRLRESEQRQLSDNSQRKVQEEIGQDRTEQNQQ